uniref:Uncharacterized protein n=1 Tax=Klebsiella pneumoniae TaxID=573 RepID=A0A2P1BPD2_KLEPN|nr:hypothetical protein [Klebsiella pneumoniae]
MRRCMGFSFRLGLAVPNRHPIRSSVISCQLAHKVGTFIMSTFFFRQRQHVTPLPRQ